MIPEHYYAYYYWLECVDFSDSEFSKIIDVIQKVVPIIDGIDEESHSFCLRFNMRKPKYTHEIKICKEYNTKVGKKFLASFQQSLGGRLYFNIKHKKIKWN